jgi:hypothetical protein
MLNQAFPAPNLRCEAAKPRIDRKEGKENEKK